MPSERQSQQPAALTYIMHDCFVYASIATLAAVYCIKGRDDDGPVTLPMPPLLNSPVLLQLFDKLLNPTAADDLVR